MGTRAVKLQNDKSSKVIQFGPNYFFHLFVRLKVLLAHLLPANCKPINHEKIETRRRRKSTEPLSLFPFVSAALTVVVCPD